MYTMKYGKEPDLWPKVLRLESEVSHIFSVPEINAVGTNDLNNAITLIEFADNDVTYREIKRNFLQNVSGGDFCYLPVFDDHWIGYSQTRGFLLFNIDDGSFYDHIPFKKPHQWITDVKVTDSNTYSFIFQVCSGNTPEDDRFLDIIQFDLQGSYTIIGEMQAGMHPSGWVEPWVVHDQKILIYEEAANSLKVYDYNFKQTTHPLATLFNNLYDNEVKFGSVFEFVIHPTLPFAVIVESTEREGNKVWLARWNQPKKDDQFNELIGKRLLLGRADKFYVSHFEFSPDGRWLVFRDESELDDNPLFIAMPINVDYENYFGKPKILGKCLRPNSRPWSTAWISEPLSYVCTDRFVLYKWELEKLTTIE